MNTLQSSLSTLSDIPPHLALLVDDMPLDQLLAVRYRNQSLIGLVPTLLSWLEDPAERSLTWQRIAPEPGQTAIAPLLMCPDDADFWCTIVVVEVEASPGMIYWHRFGYATGAAAPARMPTAIFDMIEWLTPPARLSFTTVAYSTCLDAFRRALV